MFWKIYVAALALFASLQNPQPVNAIEPFDGIQLNVIPEQCPVPNFHMQCSEYEADRKEAQEALDNLPNTQAACHGEYHFAHCVFKHHNFKKYSRRALKLMHHHTNAHTCTPNNFHEFRKKAAAARIFKMVATLDEIDEDYRHYWSSNNPAAYCTDKARYAAMVGLKHSK